MLKMLNPVNWIKSAIYSKIEGEIRTRTTKSALSEIARDAVNYLIQLYESKVDDVKAKTISSDLIFCGQSLIDLGSAIDPESEDGRKLSCAEIEAFNARVKVLFGDVITDDQINEIRERVLSLLAEKIGV